MKRYDWLRRIGQLDPESDYTEIYRISVNHEFPWDYNQSLSFALFRTYAVSTIGTLLASTGVMDDRLRAAFRYPRISAFEQALARRMIWLRGRIVRFMPPREEPLFVRQLCTIRSYPDGYDVSALGTFPR